MKYQVRTYIGIASAQKGNASGYDVGERHAFNLFMTQDQGCEPDWVKAENVLLDNCWSEVELKKTGVLDRSSVVEQGHPFSAMYDHSIEVGFALLIYQGIES